MTDIHDDLPLQESLSLEFKSDLKALPDRDLVSDVVALANTDGGELWLGVEDDGSVTGLHATHQDIGGIPALIANRTVPPLSVRVERCSNAATGKAFAKIQVPKSRQLISTTDGRLLRRRTKLDGSPESVPFYPHEITQREATLGLRDPSAIVLENITTRQLDPTQRLRIRKTIEKYNGEKSLLSLSDDELDGALGLCRETGGARHPTMAGLLLLGDEALLREHLPAHEVAFQVLRGTNVRANEILHKPLLETFDEVDALFRARIDENEIQMGLFRVPIPNYDHRAFREAFINALVHRDYGRLGMSIVKIDDDGLRISNPGGFIEGITLGNLLVADPRSRNPLLADIIKRIGLAERTGRGIDRIYEGMLRYGRPAPDFSESGDYTVAVRMSNAEANTAFLKLVLKQESECGSLPIDTLIILSRLKDGRRLTAGKLTDFIQKPEPTAHAVLERLVESGLIEAHGTGRGREYTLAASVYKRLGQKAEYVRQKGFSDIQQRQMIQAFVNEHGAVTRGEAAELCHLTRPQAYRLLKKMIEDGELKIKGERRYAVYTR